VTALFNVVESDHRAVIGAFRPNAINAPSALNAMISFAAKIAITDGYEVNIRRAERLG
jgi:hypothetical protein